MLSRQHQSLSTNPLGISIKKSNIFPKQRDGIYSDYINDQVIPSASEALHDREELRRALSAETVVKRLEESDTYTVDVTCDDNGELFSSASPTTSWTRTQSSICS